MEGTMGGKPRGSMAPPGMADEIARKKELEAMDALSRKSDDQSKKKEEKVEEERQKKIDELIPKTVPAAIGELPFETFRDIYKDVFDAVADKDHWALGFVTHSTELPGGAKAQFRTFKRFEADILRRVAPAGGLFNEGADVAAYHDASDLYQTIRILTGLVQFEGENFSLPKLDRDVKAWLGVPSVAARRDWLDALPDQLVAYMDNVISDVMFAYRLAATENLKNRFAPLSRSTE